MEIIYKTLHLLVMSRHERKSDVCPLFLSVQMKEWLGGSAHLILRFLGTTPASSDFELTLRHVRSQIESLKNPSASADHIKEGM